MYVKMMWRFYSCNLLKFLRFIKKMVKTHKTAAQYAFQVVFELFGPNKKNLRIICIAFNNSVNNSHTSRAMLPLSCATAWTSRYLTMQKTGENGHQEQHEEMKTTSVNFERVGGGSPEHCMSQSQVMRLLLPVNPHPPFTSTACHL